MHRKVDELMCHPLVLSALALWALNDHVFKAMFANALTGKLSDVCSLIVSPVLLTYALLACGAPNTRCATLLRHACLTMAVVMVAIKLNASAAEFYRVGLGLVQWPFRCIARASFVAPSRVVLTPDPSDIWTTPAVLVPWLLWWRLPHAKTQKIG